ncbi:C-5 cytosine methyltransferase DmtA [Penicillium longicatenatum]|uniref:C-5 cytosine methyltransferase DmtA n=1 Tax=Penicillium longicatenatum TaxID=1561947 RepID=UPI0025480A56|nr:C-5 cytosine methyltransferase DmtA [Penicillium longicatenatum]KAJ5657577.1 C-5 cytosine methyltransferase DmtA [Penicillium longicatenatum]
MCLLIKLDLLPPLRARHGVQSLLARRFRPPLGSSQELPIDLTGYPPKDIIDLTDEPHTYPQVGARIPSSPVVEIREQTARLTLEPRRHPSGTSSSVVVNGIIYGQGLSVELHDGNFLHIDHVSERGGEKFFHGRHLVPSTSQAVGDYIPKVVGEVIWMPHIAGLCSLDQIRCFRRIRFTNLRRKNHVSDTELHGEDDLTCRLKFTLKFRPVMRHGTRTGGSDDQEFAVEYLTYNEASGGSSVRLPANELRDQWRGRNQTTPFGTVALVPRPERLEIDLVNPDPQVWNSDDASRNRTYTFGDSYCGAGGASCGARKAGLALNWAVDMDKYAIQTYRCNFPQSLVENSTFDLFMTQTPEDLRIDVCHTSPPCQPFSPAHTVHNQVRDEQNSACIFTSLNLIKRARPRVLTMEETFGLRERHPAIFNRLIMDFIEVGYSVRWAVLDCLNYGVPQTRRRLIIIAAGPGETLPQMPPPTHGPFGSSLQPFETIHRAISDIPEGWMDHDTRGLLERTRNAHRAPYSPHQPAKTITCSGGEANYHPSGKRGLTPREVACIQTFPLGFVFCGKNRRKQIGNAVPTRLAEALFREVRKSLRRTDAKELEEARTGA